MARDIELKNDRIKKLDERLKLLQYSNEDLS
jgi:hypothetical protein